MRYRRAIRPAVIARPERRNPSSPMERRILVTGGAGYIGSALLPKLLNRGYRVRLLDALLFGSEPIAGVIAHPNLEIIHADFRQTEKVVEAMRGVDAVIHLGAIVGDPACALNEEITIEVNLLATRAIAEVAKGSGVDTFIFASTCSVYGASDDLLDEASPLNPISLYARSKIAAERALRLLADSRFAPTILRFGTVYGLSGRIRFDLVINLLTARAVVDRRITVFGGSQWRPFVHVDDVAQAILAALEAPPEQVRHQVFNVGSNRQNYTIQQIADLIHDLIPAAELVSAASDTDRRNYRVNFSKIERRLGFEPRWDVTRGVRQVIDAIDQGLVASYDDPLHSNVKYLTTSRAAAFMQPCANWIHSVLNDPVGVPASLAVAG